MASRCLTTRGDAAADDEGGHSERDLHRVAHIYIYIYIHIYRHICMMMTMMLMIISTKTTVL